MSLCLFLYQHPEKENFVKYKPQTKAKKKFNNKVVHNRRFSKMTNISFVFIKISNTIKGKTGTAWYNETLLPILYFNNQWI